MDNKSIAKTIFVDFRSLALSPYTKKHCIIIVPSSPLHPCQKVNGLGWASEALALIIYYSQGRPTVIIETNQISQWGICNSDLQKFTKYAMCNAETQTTFPEWPLNRTRKGSSVTEEEQSYRSKRPWKDLAPNLKACAFETSMT